MANTSYSLGQTLLKIENVCLEYDGRPVLKNVNGEVRDIIVPGRVQGRWWDSSVLRAAARPACSGLSRGWTSLHRAG